MTLFTQKTMASQDRRERERLATRTRIMDAARELFAKDGFETVSLRKIAEAIEYTPAAIYVHFADKESLFRELAGEDFRTLAKQFVLAENIGDPLERIASVGRAYIQFGLTHPNHYRLMFMTPHAQLCKEHASAEQTAHRGNPAEDGYAFLHKCCVDAIDKRLLRQELTDAGLVAQTMWAGVHGATSLQITMAKDGWIEWHPIAARVDMMVWTLVRGIAREPSDYPTRTAAIRSSALGSSTATKKRAKVKS